MWRMGLALLALGAVFGCAHRGYFLDEPTRRIYTKDSLGRVTKWYEPGTPEYDAIAARFWPELARRPGVPQTEKGRRTRMKRFMKGLDKDQWHILLDLEMWSGNDQVDFAHLEELERMARAVKGVGFSQYLDLKKRYPIRSDLRARLMDGER